MKALNILKHLEFIRMEAHQIRQDVFYWIEGCLLEQLQYFFCLLK